MSNVGLSYRDSGVDISVADATKNRIKSLVRKTFTSNVLSGIGGFGGLFAAQFGKIKEPVLVSSADGVGTKLKLAFMTGIHHTVGQDLVNHCVNDILAMGARPLFFLDYFATGKLQPGVTAEVIKGLAQACKENGCALIGGETAEMPGFYSTTEYDLAGFIVGVVDRRQIIDGSNVRAGDLLVGLASTGLHTNGYSLARKLFFDELRLDVNDRIETLGTTVAQALMAVHRSYLKPVMAVLGKVKVVGLAHITGGGIPGNLVRILPKNCRALVYQDRWKLPKLFEFIRAKGQISNEEMYATFNMGIGMILVIRARDLEAVQKVLRSQRAKSFVIGEITAGHRAVTIV